MSEAVSAPEAASSVQLGLRENWPQFCEVALNHFSSLLFHAALRQLPGHGRLGSSQNEGRLRFEHALACFSVQNRTAGSNPSITTPQISWLDHLLGPRE